ncbi:MAG: tetratricopeptide repeat protein [Gemmatimonadota bacterium]
MVTVELLGGATLRSGNTPLRGPPAQRHRLALLALVVSAWPHPLARERAMALLWPERDTAAARRLLNLAVHVLRSALGEHAIASAGDGLLFTPGMCDCDLHELRVAIAAHDIDAILEWSTAPLLDGFHLDDAIDFDQWLDAQRHELGHAHVGALRSLAERQERAGDLQGWVGTCRRLVLADPHSSLHALTLMRALDATGDRAAAISHSVEHAKRLRVDLGLGADPDVVALADNLRHGSRHTSTTIGASRHPRQPTVAVLPFRTLGGASGEDYFADGITEDVITHLSKIRNLRVISRGSVIPFRERQQSATEFGRTLGATALLDGSVRTAGDRVRIVARLIDVASAAHLWAETYDRELTDIFAIQADVALQIAAALATELSRDEQARVRKVPTTDFQAYQLFLKGRQWHTKYTPEGYERAVEYFERAIARDPTFAMAHARMALALSEAAETGHVPPGPAYRRALVAVTEALRLDPDLGAAHCTAGCLKGVAEFDWLGAEREFKRALELNPGDADSYNQYGRFCAALGRLDESIALQQRANELDPLVHRLDSVTTLLRAGRHAEAVTAAEAAIEVDPQHDRGRATLGWAYLLAGREVEGLAEIERAVEVSQRDSFWLGQLGIAYGRVGEAAKARAVLTELERRASTEYVSPYHLAYAYLGVADTERSLDWLERAVTEHAGPVYSIKASFLLAPLHRHPRFDALLQQMGLS